MPIPPFKMVTKTEMEVYRYSTWNTKEPETIKWIESFPKGAVFYDVGSNVGIFSLFAASLGKCKVIYAFEPDLLNYTRLVANIKSNRFHVIRPIFKAISNKNKIAQFYVKKIEAGSSGGQIDEPIDEYGKKFKAEQVNHVETVRLDTWTWIMDGALRPTHIKIDIDGQELKVIGGMGTGRIWDEVKSILVERNEDTGSLHMILRFLGFNTNSPLNSIPDHSRHRRKAEGIKAENVIYSR